jgi:hypothetical protein
MFNRYDITDNRDKPSASSLRSPLSRKPLDRSKI